MEHVCNMYIIIMHLPFLAADQRLSLNSHKMKDIDNVPTYPCWHTDTIVCSFYLACCHNLALPCQIRIHNRGITKTCGVATCLSHKVTIFSWYKNTMVACIQIRYTCCNSCYTPSILASWTLHKCIMNIMCADIADWKGTATVIITSVMK